MNKAKGFKGGNEKKKKTMEKKTKLKEMQRMKMRQLARWGDVWCQEAEIKESEVDAAGRGVGIADLFLSNLQTETSSLKAHLCMKHPDPHATIYQCCMSN